MPDQRIQSANTLPQDFVAAHGRVVADKTLQFSLNVMPKIEPPAWVKWLDAVLKPIANGLKWFFDAFGPVGLYLFWGLVAAALGLVLFLILRALGYVEWSRRKVEDDTDVEWQPAEAPARKLLAEADALAAEGHYEEAAHLLLLRSFEDIDARRPTLLKPAITAREMAQSAALPATARTTFAQIARHVEASLFGGAKLDADRWAECREAYKRFAFAGDWL